MLRNKKYGMGGAVQSFSSPMLAQGMQGGLSGFGTSGLGTFADGGQVRVVKKNEGNYWYRRTEGAIGSFAWRYDKNYNEGILFPLDKFYSDFYKNVKLKQGEVLFRYETDRMMGRMQPLIKFNLDKSLIYFGVDSDEDEPNFETKGIKAEYIVLEEGYDKKFAKGGQIAKDFYVVVQLPNGLITKKDFDGFSKDEIIQWCEERGWKYNAKGEKFGGQVLKNYEFFIKESKRVNVGQLPSKKFAKGGEIVQLPPKGELTNKDNLLLKYHKVGSNYEFYVYEPISKEVSGYNQIKFVCKNSDCALKMNYKEFINYLYSELYLDDKKYAKGGKIIDQYDERTPEDIWNNLSARQRGHFLSDHIIQIEDFKNVREGSTTGKEMVKWINSDWDSLDKDIKNRFDNHTREGQYAKGGQIASIGDSGIITDKNSMFVGKMALITGDLGNMYEVRVGERTTIVKKNGIRIISDEYAHGGEIHNSAKQMSDEDFEIAYNKLTPSEKNEVKSLIRLGDDKKLALATILAESKKPSSSDFYKRAYEYSDGGKTRKSGNVPRIAKKVAEVNALIEKGNSLGLEVVDTSTTWQSPMKYKPIKYVNGILYIEYEKLDLYALSKRGVQKWDIQKDKVLKRNMEFDNPLNDIAKMYRKAIREREQYFSDGGDVEDRHRFNSARTMGRYSQNWEAILKEYAGEDYKNLTPREKEEIIADMQRGYDRNTHFAKGGKITHSNEPRNISEKQKRATYVLAFGQEYDAENRRQSPLPLDIAYQLALHSLERKKNEMAKGGQTKPKRSRITLIMDGQKYSYPVAIVNGQVEITDETFKDGVLREYLDKEFDLWLDQAPSDYEEMYYGDESIMSKRGAIEGAMEYVSLTIEDEAPKKTTFNFDEGDIEFDSAYEYERGGSIAVSDDEKRKSLKGNLKIKF